MASRHLTVLLHDVAVGSLSLNQNEGTEFRLFESYKHAFPRPVLGQTFLDDLDAVHRSRNRVPAWFSNLLPEGALRELVARHAGVPVSREFFLLEQLGEDLPGAVRLLADEEQSAQAVDAFHEENPIAASRGEMAWHFSLAGVQLKFSALRSGRGLTIPVAGRGGDWIVKLPDSRFEQVPANEHATMRWAKFSGIDVPDIELLSMDDIEGLPDEVQQLRERTAYAIRRFDRPGTGSRTHIEDFAQLLGIFPEGKYDKANYETLAKLTLSLTGDAGLREFIHRLVFILASGNGDAHLKNWSLLYPDSMSAQLAPAYDLVSTIQYMPQDQLALNLGKSKSWEDIDLAMFRRMARRIDFSEGQLLDYVGAAVERVLDSWHHHHTEFGYGPDARKQLSAHMQRIPLLRQT